MRSKRATIGQKDRIPRTNSVLELNNESVIEISASTKFATRSGFG